jgi:hypothetical protein
MKNKYSWYNLGAALSFTSNGFCVYSTVTHQTWALILASIFIFLAFVLYVILYKLGIK